MGNSSAARRSPAERRPSARIPGDHRSRRRRIQPAVLLHFGRWRNRQDFLFNAIIAKLRTLCIGRLALAPTGIAALLLRFGQTAHSCFKIPNDVDYSTVPGIQIHHKAAERIRQTRLIIIDEISMLHGAVFDYIDRTIRACYLATDPESQQLFGGKCVLISGDFKQLPPVAPGKGKYGEISASIASSPLFQKFKHIDLKKNMRVDANEVEFGRWLKNLAPAKTSWKAISSWPKFRLDARCRP
ncbi:hypothetical protein L596_030689 [Steinernema carpocapsae]|uniref:ATP-dependent DNA helicase n=1 Tax=Steinernema carpocapsae TaxID=34508 RepID=A0A4U5LNG6_STECR|nr:hypothetical protein L596_030689 [Steinernema carpocapsae]